MKLKIVHALVDQKFLDGAISLYETDNRVENTYVFVGKKTEPKYLKYSDVYYVDQDNALEFLNKFDVVIVHSLRAIPMNILKDIRQGVKVVWYGWGFDIYESPFDFVPIPLYGSETKKNTRYIRFRSFIGKNKVKKRFYLKTHFNSILKRIDYFSGVFPYEIDLIKERHPQFNAQPLDFYYGAKDFFIPEEPSMEIRHNKKNIIIGNSANMTGNHLDVIKAISSVNIDKEAKLIIPLSYGGLSTYINQVEKAAEEIAPGQVVSLRNYLPLNDYLDLISNCKTAIFAHERQQASDNIFMQLLYGARVYMSETSSAFVYLRSIGLKVYSLQSDLDLFNEEMSDEDVFSNREILSSLYSSSKLIERVKEINTILIDSK